MLSRVVPLSAIVLEEYPVQNSSHSERSETCGVVVRVLQVLHREEAARAEQGYQMLKSTSEEAAGSLKQ